MSAGSLGGSTGPTVVGTASTVAESDKLPPTPRAGVITLVLVIGSVLIAAFSDLGDGFTPRVETLDALAGLSIGAFIVDRLLTFVPPWGAAKAPLQRATDLKVLRLGYGAALGMIFVVLTDLRAVHILTPDTSKAVGAGVDRAIAVLAIAGGIAGLARLTSGINPQPLTDGGKSPQAPVVDTDADTVPPPSTAARLVGVIAVGIGAALAVLAIGDKDGVDLVGPDKLADGTVALIVRFGLVFLAATIVEQIAEVIGRVFAIPKNNRALVLGGLSVILGIVAARVFDLFLLHNIGFFGATPGRTLSDALSASTGLERWADTFFTGLVIAAGTKPLHDVSSRLRKAKKT
jgi:hypothetical protein